MYKVEDSLKKVETGGFHMERDLLVGGLFLKMLALRPYIMYRGTWMHLCECVHTLLTSGMKTACALWKEGLRPYI
jgi:hypothetical protein